MAIQNKKKSITVLVTGTRLVTAEYTVRKARLAAFLFQQEHGIRAERIDGRKVMGHCSQSGRLILEGDSYLLFEDQEMRLIKEVNDPVKAPGHPRHR